MELTNGQAEARRRIFAWRLAEQTPDFVLHGYAGSGKTSLVKHLTDEARGYVPVLALTNKAVQVLRGKGIKTAQTIHSFLYPRVSQGLCECRTDDNPLPEIHAKDCPATKPIFSVDPLAPEDVQRPSMIIVDECSMVPEKIAHDILAKGIPVLAVGDPFQLQPVEGKPYWNTPDYVLSEIMRQAADNPIIRLAHDVRLGRGLRAGTYGETIITNDSLLQAGPDMDDFDQVLTFRHVTRCRYTAMYREAMGWTVPGDDEPKTGETIMMRSNHKELGVANGDMFVVETCKLYGATVYDIKLAGLVPRVHVWRDGFGNAEAWDKLGRMDSSILRRHGKANYGYVITTHSAQGSEWDRVLVAKDKNRSPNWMYTALTRARTKAMVCLGSD